MKQKQAEALWACVKDNAIDTLDLYKYLNTIHPGDFHFTNGTHFPVLIPGLTADGVFINSQYYVTKWERSDGKTSYKKAKKYCKHRGCVLPDWETLFEMERWRSVINKSLEALGFPLLEEGEYWFDYDAECKKLSTELITCPHEDLGDVTDDLLALGEDPNKNEKDQRYVRGCIKVTWDNQKVYTVKNVNQDESGTVLAGILNDFGVTRGEFLHYLKNKKLYPRAGYYLLNSGASSESTVYDQEAGIFANANLYITLDMHKAPLTVEQTKVYLKANEGQIPEYFDLRQISKAAPYINKALIAIGMKDFVLPEYILKDCWCKESFEAAVQNAGANDIKKRVLLIGHQQNVNSKYLVIEDIWQNVSLD